MRVFLSITAIFIAFSVIEASGQTAPAPFSVTRLSERLSIIHGGSGYGAHVGLCEGDEGLLMVDTMLSSSAYQLESAVRSISDKPVEWVINTHDHSDHSGGNSHFSSQGAVIIAHEATKYGPSQVDLRTEAGFVLDYCGEPIKALPLIAHSYGDLLIYFEDSNVLFMGDAFGNAYYPSGYARGQLSELESVNIAKSLADAQTMIVPGHGFIDDVSGLDRYAGQVAQWYRRLSELTAANSSVNDMLQDDVLLKLSEAFLEHATPNFDVNVRLERFIQRTLSTDFVQQIELTAEEKNGLVGWYRTDEGAPIAVVVEDDDRMLVKQEGGFIEEIVPIAQGVFHVRGALQGRALFSLDENGTADKITIDFGHSRLVGKRKQ